MSSPPNFRIAVLLCDTPLPAVRARYATYGALFHNLLHKANPDASFTMDEFDVVNEMRYPDFEKERYDGVILTGAAASAYNDIPWINKLVEWVATTVETYPKVKIIGICFGHQIIARALGGEVVPNKAGWEVAVNKVDLTDLGKIVFKTDNSAISVQQMHRDHVTSLPPNALSLGSSPISPQQGFVILYPGKGRGRGTRVTDDDRSQSQSQSYANINTMIHVFTIQGHPEFVPDVVTDILEARKALGVIPPDVLEAGFKAASDPNDGAGLVGQAIWRVLGVDSE